MRKTPEKKMIMDAVLLGNIDWERARAAAYKMASDLQCEVAGLTDCKDAYSPVAWMNICRQLRIVTDGMTAMRLASEGKTSQQIAESTGIAPGSIAAYKAWNTMYLGSIQRKVRRRVALKGRTVAEKNADADFLRACGIAFELDVKEVKKK